HRRETICARRENCCSPIPEFSIPPSPCPQKLKAQKIARWSPPSVFPRARTSPALPAFSIPLTQTAHSCTNQTFQKIAGNTQSQPGRIAPTQCVSLSCSFSSPSLIFLPECFASNSAHRSFRTERANAFVPGPLLRTCWFRERNLSSIP